MQDVQNQTESNSTGISTTGVPGALKEFTNAERDELLNFFLSVSVALGDVNMKSFGRPAIFFTSFRFIFCPVFLINRKLVCLPIVSPLTNIL
jgi:hypothetical protein